MKKITANRKSFGAMQSLTRQQLKNVMGGVLPEPGTPYCKTTACTYLKNVGDTTLTSAKCGTKNGPGPQTSACDGVFVTSDCDLSPS